MQEKVAIFFGGSGFIGSHLSCHFLERNLVTKVICADIAKPNFESLPVEFKKYFELKKIEYVYCDVREKIALDLSNVSLVVNLAAIHRVPGHDDSEYFDTNVKGAKSVCRWVAGLPKAVHFVFTSSISPYGPSEERLVEGSELKPTTAYGKSKKIAEKIHVKAFTGSSKFQNLVILRPGVVFGQGEGGNITRMIKALKKRYFIFCGNKNVLKAGIYVKELCLVTEWCLSKVINKSVTVCNLSFSPIPTINAYVEAILKVLGRKHKVYNLPLSVLIFIAYIINISFRLFGVVQGINPARVKKIVRSNNITPEYLVQNSYNYKYNLTSALEDWKSHNDELWS